MPRVRFTIFSLATLAGCATSGVPAPAPIPDETLVVWAAALDAFHHGERPTGTLWLAPAVSAEARNRFIDSLGNPTGPNTPGAASLYLAWVAANRDTLRLERRPRIPGYDFRLFQGVADGTPGVVIYSVSLPGYSRSGDSVMVNVGRSCGSLCGRFSQIFLVRDSAGRWSEDPLIDPYQLEGVPTPQAAPDSTGWSLLLAPAIVGFLLRDSMSVPAEIVAREPASPWTHALLLEVRRQVEAGLGRRVADSQRIFEIQDPIPPTIRERPDRRVFIEVPLVDAWCTAPPGGGQAAYFGISFVAQVVETRDGSKAKLIPLGNFDGVCSNQPGPG